MPWTIQSRLVYALCRLTLLYLRSIPGLTWPTYVCSTSLVIDHDQQKSICVFVTGSSAKVDLVVRLGIPTCSQFRSSTSFVHHTNPVFKTIKSKRVETKPSNTTTEFPEQTCFLRP
ncbi:hypothetical protein OUZ56_011634 [Daphnia magna]|uniref:Secreted protein n=1 Tax=Daphnia magna TaxID=35525 RepID=A0ABQ9Z0P5_9CRUS|nr:hypothetical protein OUZ56_011634 [Daphnia magna]